MYYGLPARAQVAGPDIEVQTILTGSCKFRDEHVYRWRIGRLRRLSTKGKCIAHTAPRFNRLRRAEPIGAKGRRGVGNALKYVDAISNASTDLSVTGSDFYV